MVCWCWGNLLLFFRWIFGMFKHYHVIIIVDIRVFLVLWVIAATFLHSRLWVLWRHSWSLVYLASKIINSLLVRFLAGKHSTMLWTHWLPLLMIGNRLFFLTHAGGWTSLGLVCGAALTAIRITFNDFSTALRRERVFILVLPGHECYHVGDHGLDTIEGLPNAIHF